MVRARVLRACATRQRGRELNAEIIGVGTELLLGQIANTNAQRISQELAAIGVDVFFHTVVGDNLRRAAESIATAVRRSDAVIVTGGLGPTPDDLTREAIAEATGRPLVRDPRLEAQVQQIFQRLNRPMPETNLRQADLPQGAVAIPPQGTAPGFHLEHEGRLIVALPGVPWEMEAMLQESVLPLFKQRLPHAAIVSREVLVIGLGESATHEQIADIVAAQSNPTIAYLAGGGVVRVRITAKAADEPGALALIAPVEREVRARLGPHAAEAPAGTLASALGAALRAKHASVAAAESLTGGLLGAALSSEPGASDYFLGSIVCYTTAAKLGVAGVPEEVLERAGAVSEPAARALAEAAIARYGADLGLGTTGVAGPAEANGKPVGTIFVAASLAGRTSVREVRGIGSRDNIRNIAVTSALDLGRRVVLDRG